MTKVTPAAFDFTVACEALARRGDDLTYAELEAWAMDVAYLAGRINKVGKRATFDRMRGRTYRSSGGGEGRSGRIAVISPELRFNPGKSRLVPIE